MIRIWIYSIDIYDNEISFILNTSGTLQNITTISQRNKIKF